MSPTSAVPALLDANVPMYAAGAAHPYHDSCQWIMRQIAQRALAVAIDVEIIQEILHRYGALGRHLDAVTMATDLLALVPIVYPVNAADAQTAIILYQNHAPRGIRSRDVIHAAVMVNNGLAEIISADRHFDLIAGIRRIDPIALYQQAQPQLP